MNVSNEEMVRCMNEKRPSMSTCAYFYKFAKKMCEIKEMVPCANVGIPPEPQIASICKTTSCPSTIGSAQKHNFEINQERLKLLNYRQIAIFEITGRKCSSSRLGLTRRTTS